MQSPWRRKSQQTLKNIVPQIGQTHFPKARNTASLSIHLRKEKWEIFNFNQNSNMLEPELFLLFSIQELI